MNQEKVLIAMSGGGDSPPAALLLQKQGYACAGARLRLHAGAQECGCRSGGGAPHAPRGAVPPGRLQRSGLPFSPANPGPGHPAFI